MLVSTNCIPIRRKHRLVRRETDEEGREGRENDNGSDLHCHTDQSDRDDCHDEPGNAHSAVVVVPPCVVAEQIERTPATQPDGSDVSERIADVGERLLDSEGDEDDAPNERQMKDAVRIACQERPLVTAYRGEFLPCGEDDVIEVEPPQCDDE
jgi:hypothetical protein